MGDLGGTPAEISNGSWGEGQSGFQRGANTLAGGQERGHAGRNRRTGYRSDPEVTDEPTVRILEVRKAAFSLLVISRKKGLAALRGWSKMEENNDHLPMQWRGLAWVRGADSTGRGWRKNSQSRVMWSDLTPKSLSEYSHYMSSLI